MTDTHRTLLLVALIAAVIALLAIGSHFAKVEPVKQEPVKWDELTTCMYSCPAERPA